MSITSNLNFIRQKIDAAAICGGRQPEAVKLLAVSKMVPIDKMREAIIAGQILFGENYVKPALEKLHILRQEYHKDRFQLHMIGALQRNKVRAAVGHFDLIQSVDRYNLAEEISKIAVGKNLIQDVLLQVNISGEESKSGVEPENALDLATQIVGLPGIRLCGLMSIGSWNSPEHNSEKSREEFKAMRALRNTLELKLSISLPELSMGMSDDFELAIQEGATIVRVGTAIFGAR